MRAKQEWAIFAVWSVWACAVLLGAVTIGWRISTSAFFPTDFQLVHLVGPLQAIGGFVLLLPAIIGWGCLAGRALCVLPTDSLAGRGLVSLLLGQLMASLVIMAIGFAGLFPLGVWLVLLGAGGLVPEAVHWRRAVLMPRGPSRLWLAGAVLVCAAAFVAACAPVVESDGLRYHLFTPQEWLKAGGIVHLPHHAFSNLPLQQNLLYLAGLVFGNGSTAHLLHWPCLPAIMLASGLLAQCVVRELCGERDSEWPFAAALVVGTMPVMLVLAGWPFIDLATLAFTLGSVWAARGMRLSCERHRLVLAGLLAGAAIATKLTALIPGFLLGVGLLLHVLLCVRSSTNLASRFQAALVVVVFFGVPILLVPAPWMVKSALLHGNPVYPAAYGTFGGPEWSAETDAFYNDRAAQRGFGKSIGDLIASPVDITLRWSRLPGDMPSELIRQEASERGWPSRLWMKNSPGFEEQNPGPAPLVFLPLAIVALFIATQRFLAQRSASSDTMDAFGGITLLLALQLIGGWGAWFLTYQSTRFVLAPLVVAVILGVPMLAVICRGDRVFRWASRAIVASCAVAGFAWFMIYSLFISPTIFTVMGLIDPEWLIERRFNAYPAIRHLNAEAGDAGTFFIGEHRGFHAQTPVVLSDWFDTPLILTEIQRTPDNATLLRHWRERGIGYVLLNQEELGLYEAGLFRPRFNDQEWARFVALREQLLADPNAFAFRDPDRAIWVIDLNRFQ